MRSCMCSRIDSSTAAWAIPPARGRLDALAARPAFFRRMVSRFRDVASVGLSQRRPAMRRARENLAAHGRVASPWMNSDRGGTEELSRRESRCVPRPCALRNRRFPFLDHIRCASISARRSATPKAGPRSDGARDHSNPKIRTRSERLRCCQSRTLPSAQQFLSRAASIRSRTAHPVQPTSSSADSSRGSASSSRFLGVMVAGISWVCTV